jgi:hypothetical protein
MPKERQSFSASFTNLMEIHELLKAERKFFPRGDNHKDYGKQMTYKFGRFCK